MKIAIDAMSGDNGLDAVIPALKSLLNKISRHKLDLSISKFFLVGRKQEILQSLIKYKLDLNKYKFISVELINASEVVHMDDEPRDALRYKKDSSMRIAINLVKDGRADAIVSAGNTGALMATSKFVLKTIPGIERPAIATKMPSRKGSVTLLDLGANLHVSAQNLYQFALMGSTLRQIDCHNSTKPKVALLNIGEESIKGPEFIKEAAALISSNKEINYIGFIESNYIHSDIADVIISDGFTGNIVLKTIEGLAKFIKDILSEEFKKNIFTKLAALIIMPVLYSFKHRLDPRQYNGASLLGLNGTVIKSHGSADSYSFECAIIQAANEVKNNVVSKLKEKSEMFYE